MKTMKYINQKGIKDILIDYKIDKEGNIFKKDKKINIYTSYDNYQYCVINKKRYYIQRAIASTYDEKNYKKNAFAINGKWIDNKEKYTKERNEKISKSKKGRKLSKETIDKMTAKRKRPVIQYDKNFNKINEFDSAKNAYLSTNIPASSITYNCQRKRKTAGGFIFRYKEEKNESK